MRLSGLRWVTYPPRVMGRDAADELARATALSEVGALPAAEFVAPATSIAAAATSLVPTHDPPLAPRDEATFLLHIAAEIEHALMVQYLYAGYSLDPQSAGLTPAQGAQVANWKRTVLSIAKEEMGHFISVQNILIGLGAPLNFAREAYPFRSAFYPFEFKLEPLTIKRRKPLAAAVKASKNDARKIERALFSASLNRYIAAEMPVIELVPAADQALVKALTQGEEVNRVGLLFKRLLDLFDAGSDGGLVDADFDAERLDAQGHEQEWGGADTDTPFKPLVRPVKTRAEARALLAEIAEQGEGHQEGALTSHFQRFLAIYKELEQFPPKQSYLHAVASNPSTTGETGTAITNPRTRGWAQLLNLRYRLLLGYLWHFLSVGGDRFAPNGDHTAHGWLVAATFIEMSHVKELSELLVGLDLDTAGPSRAGPPFELPYGLTLPEREKDRFRRHLDVLTAARRLALTLETTLAAGTSGAEREGAILAAMAERDALASAELDQLRQGLKPPPQTGFAKVRRILDEALRGFPLARTGHDEFWRVDEEQFPAAAPAGFPAVTPGDGANSNLVKALRGEAPFGSDLGVADAYFRRMPAGRAPVDPTRIAFIEQWIDALQAADPTDPNASSNGNAPMGRYQEIIDILDAAAGGSASPVGAHGAFWRGKTRDQFVAASVFGQKLLIAGDGAGSNLVRALLGEMPFGNDIGAAGGIFRRMPAGRPAVPAASVEVIKTWIDDNCPD